MIMINLYSGAFQISLINLVINGLANSGDAYAQNYLLIPRLPILMALSSSSTTTSWAASPPTPPTPPPFSSSTLWHPRFCALAWQLPYNSSYDHRHHHVLTIWISAIIFITTAPTYVTISAAPRCSRRLLWSQKVLSTLRCEESTVCHPGGSLNSRVMVTRPHLSFPFVGQRI